ncbi:uncharacterized protein A4U43_C08F1640 [Asparagus officinalis]|nr:uncharacterized protein A4U43_C08F1640 [Asparagus officinalis]
MKRAQDEVLGVETSESGTNSLATDELSGKRLEIAMSDSRITSSETSVIGAMALTSIEILPAGSKNFVANSASQNPNPNEAKNPPSPPLPRRTRRRSHRRSPNRFLTSDSAKTTTTRSMEGNRTKNSAKILSLPMCPRMTAT